MPGKTQTVEIEPTLTRAIRDHDGFAALVPWIGRMRMTLQGEETVRVTFTEPGLASLFSEDLRQQLTQAVRMQLGAAATVQYREQHATPTTPRDQHMTFDNFMASGGARLSAAAARAVVESPGTRYNPLLIHGANGVGKTHLLQAIHNAIHARNSQAATPSNPGSTSASPLRVCYLTGDLLTQSLSAMARENGFLAWREELLTYQVLLLDDLHQVLRLASLRDPIASLLDRCHAQNVQVVLSMRQHPQAMEELEDGLRSRLQWGLVVGLEPLDQEALALLIRRKALSLRIELPADVIEYLVLNSNADIRALEGLLNRLASHATLLSEPITLRLVRSIQGAQQDMPTFCTGLDDICAALCTYFNVTQEQLVSKSRARSIAYPRQVGMYLGKTLTSSSLEEIGRCFGGRDHSTVKHGYEKIRGLLTTDPTVRGQVEECRKLLRHVRG